MLQYWIAASMVEGIGPVKLKKLLELHGSITRVCEAIGAPLEKAETIIRSAKEKEIAVFDLLDRDYPAELKNIYDPPSVLYCKGSRLPQDEKAIAIVGTRQASRYGLDIARKFAHELASLGFTIVSGMALGIDTAAHQGALHSGGRTIAVLGCGVDVIYPRDNQYLYHSIIKSGTMVSEFIPGSGPDTWHFPQRNRIISGLSLGVIVVEGHYDSGAMITAKCALDQGREVFAIPGNIDFDQSKGPHWLIKQGAKLVESIEDVLEELTSRVDLPAGRAGPFIQTRQKSQIQITGRDYSNFSAEEQKILTVLSADPKHIDAIAYEAGIPIAQVSSSLMMLEMKQEVKQLAGKSYILFP